MIRRKRIIRESLIENLSQIKNMKDELQEKINEVLPRNRFGIVRFDIYKDDDDKDVIEITGFSASNRGNRDEEIFSILITEINGKYLVRELNHFEDEYDECDTVDDVKRSINNFVEDRLENV